jgi:hypothetical protein
MSARWATAVALFSLGLAVDQGVPRYRYDPARARQYLEEAVLTLAGDDADLLPNGEPFKFDYGFITSGGTNLLDHIRAEIPEASNRWQGRNRGERGRLFQRESER